MGLEGTGWAWSWKYSAWDQHLRVGLRSATTASPQTVLGLDRSLHSLLKNYAHPPLPPQIKSVPLKFLVHSHHSL